MLRCRKNVRYSLIEELTRLISWKRCFVLYLYISVGLFFMGVKFKIRLQLVRIYIYFFLSVSCARLLVIDIKIFSLILNDRFGRKMMDIIIIFFIFEYSMK